LQRLLSRRPDILTVIQHIDNFLPNSAQRFYMGRKLLKRSCEWRLVVEVSFFFHIVDSADYAIGICEKNFDKLLDNLIFTLYHNLTSLF
jgi:hypothetical protein